MLNRKNLTLKVTGRVQGVFYRATANEIAIEIGLKGFVMNMNDGSVFIEAEGTAEQLTKFIEWCKLGPSRSIVTDVNIQEGTVKEFTDFKIRY